MFDGIKNTAAAVRVAIAVDKSAAGAGVLKLAVVGHGEQFRLTGSHVRTLIHEEQQGAKPVRRYLHIGVQEQIVLGLYLTKGLVITLCETIISIKDDEPNLRKVVTEEGEGVVG